MVKNSFFNTAKILSDVANLLLFTKLLTNLVSNIKVNTHMDD